MKVRMTFEFDESDRIAIARHMGEDKPAAHGNIKSLIGMLVEAWRQDMVADADGKKSSAEEGAQ